MEIQSWRKLIADNVERMAAGGTDQAIAMETLDAIVSLQEHPLASRRDIDITSELYAFIVDQGEPVIHSDIQDWRQAKASADALLHA